MTRRWTLLALLPLLAGCGIAPAPDTIAIVGATLIAEGRDTIPYSIVLVKGGTITAVGTQAGVPIPKTSAITDGLRQYLVATDATGKPTQGRLEPGQPANLALLDGDPRQGTPHVVRLLLQGTWKDAPRS